jgi:CheY-like chemotaxis protein
MTEGSGDLAVRTRPLNLLIVDDSAMMRTRIRRVAMLCDLPVANIYEAGNGSEAIQILREHPVDCLFTGINMPVMTGIELLREIEKNDDWRDLKRVIVSTDGSTARRQEVRDLNIRLYVEKLFRPEVIRDVLREIATTAGVR